MTNDEKELMQDLITQASNKVELLQKTVIEKDAEIERLKAGIKQAQVDTINTIVEYCETPSHWNELKDCKLFGGKSDDLRVFLNGIFKENSNEKA